MIHLPGPPPLEVRLACYCLHRLDQQGRLIDSTPVDASTDSEALSTAAGLLQGSLCELWIGTVFVAEIEADGTVTKSARRR